MTSLSLSKNVTVQDSYRSPYSQNVIRKQEPLVPEPNRRIETTEGSNNDDQMKQLYDEVNQMKKLMASLKKGNTVGNSGNNIGNAIGNSGNTIEKAIGNQSSTIGEMV